MRQRIESLEQFRALQADYMAARDAEKRKILVCCGTGCPTVWRGRPPSTG
mgnify:CR=1 FL=1